LLVATARCFWWPGRKDSRWHQQASPGGDRKMYDAEDVDQVSNASSTSAAVDVPHCCWVCTGFGARTRQVCSRQDDSRCPPTVDGAPEPGRLPFRRTVGVKLVGSVRAKFPHSRPSRASRHHKMAGITRNPTQIRLFNIRLANTDLHPFQSNAWWSHPTGLPSLQKLASVVHWCLKSAA
jgi:hypothetical protein